ncbi:MAG: hypothetical protein DI622_11430 [Chryseobacterium sp.]|uniref:ParB N-terminal domain-containing protein n=1 Tax=Chryseobacterium sp. TaxID=1871047 RepID=UPI000DB611B5|nr:ParB N-terminal domain-containing protein [Chryseobacterium sp.]MPS66823.1 hypothetical protein [Chryseobacterium sp.]PZU16619.1 MAG: hypothetical protein DI622_11430 [Chryseobacterium sp.]
MDKDYFSIENQIIRREKSILHEKNKKRFKELLKNSDYNLIPKWHLCKNEIDLSYLRSHRHIELVDNDCYNLYSINRDELFRILDQSYTRVFTKSKIWKSHNEDKIIRVLNDWENDTKLIPPVIILNLSDTKFLIQDGNHRLAVANYFDSKEIPVIILNSVEDRFLATVKLDKVKKLN